MITILPSHSFVTLNSFQGPLTRLSASAWMLKQVQHDDFSSDKVGA
jgi:hypothetical protein